MHYKSYTMKTISTLLLCSMVPVSRAQFKNNTDCSTPTFGVVSIYYLYQPGTTFSVGAETGTWNGEEDSRFSYFFGMYLLQYSSTYKQAKGSGYTSAANVGLYAKGQMRLADHIYLTASPEFVNFQSFEFRSALRFTFNVSQTIGISFDPGYAMVSKTYSFATNIHFAL
jgi:hypothetical protein